MGDWIVGGLIGAAVVLALRSLWRNIKAGECPGGCAGCGKACSCHQHQGQ
jgi:hypothetical protein